MSIRRQMILVFGLVALLPLAAAAVFFQQFNQIRLQRSANARLIAEARRVATEVDSFLRRQTEATRQAGLMPTLSRFAALPDHSRLEDQTEITQLMFNVIVDDPVNVSSCAVLNRAGRNVVDIAPGLFGRSEAEAPWFREPLRTGLPFSGVGGLPGEPPALWFSAPIRDARGEIVGVLRTRNELAILKQLATLAIGSTSRSLVAGLFERSGRPLVLTEGFRPQVSPALAPEQLGPPAARDQGASFWVHWSLEAAARDERDRAAAVPLLNAPWSLAVAETESEFSAPVAELTRTILIFGALTIGLVIVAVLVIARNLSRPVVELAQVVRQGAEGDLSIAAGEHLTGEVGALAADYNRMAERLRRTLAELERRLAELEAAEARMREIIEASPVASMVYRAGSEVQQVNRKFTELFGYQPADLSSVDDWWTRAYPDPSYRSSVQHLLRARIAEAGPDQFEIRPFEAMVTCADGRRIQIEFHRRTIGDRVLVVMIDLTEHKRALEALRANEERFRLLHEHAPDAVIVYDADHATLVDCNPAAERLFKYPRETLLSSNRPGLSVPVQPDGRSAAEAGAAHIAEALAGRMPVYAWSYVDAQGKPLDCEVRLLRFPDPGGRRLLRASIVDISERTRADEQRKALETQLRQAQKMEAIGTLAGGIAHDFNNILTGILGNLELASQSRDLDASTRTLLGDAARASLRARDLVSKILTFSRRREQQQSVQSLAPILHETGALLRASLPATVRIQLNPGPDHLLVRCDAGQMHQVFMNLGTNAGHAMLPAGGLLTFTLDEIEVPADGREPRARFPGGRAVRLTVRDTGVGMAPEVRDRVFEPFFTTKPVGEGSGLGLSVVHGIIEDHGGTIRIDSTPGLGTTFEIWLPPAQAERDVTAAPANVPEEPAAPRGHGERLLLIDDEASVAAVGEKMLSMLGYAPVKFTDPAEALAAFRRDPQGFAAIVSDLTMPEVSGPAVVREVRQHRPEIPVLILTGFMRSSEVAQMRNLGVEDFLEKPFTFASLGDAIHRAMRPR